MLDEIDATPRGMAVGLADSSFTRLPASATQQRYWVTQHITADPAVDHVCAKLILRGAFDAVVFNQAVQRSIRRNEILRTCFEFDGSKLHQKVFDDFHQPPHHTDLSDLDSDAQATEVERLARQAVSQPFRLDRLPLTRLHVVRLSEAEHLVLFVAHHVVIDGWSVPLLVEDLRREYSGALAGSPEVADDNLQYGDYALWEEECIGTDRHKQALDYWTQRLATVPGRLEFPTDRRPGAPSAAGALVALDLPQDLARRVRETAREFSCSPFVVVLAALQGVLSRYCDQTNFGLSVLTSGRFRPETATMLGCFLNPITVVADIAPDGTFADLVVAARQDMSAGLKHQIASIDVIVQRMRQSARGEYSPFSNVNVVYQDLPMALVEEGAEVPLGLLGPQGPALSVVRLPIEYARSDLSLTILPFEDRLALECEYATAVLDRSTVRQFLGHLAGFLRQGLEAPDRPIFDLLLLSKAEEDDLRRMAAGPPMRSPVYLPGAIRRWAADKPKAAAVVSTERAITFEELFNLSNGVAQRLRDTHGIGEGAVIGLAVQPCWELVVLMTALLDLGAAYVPLDPSYPPERLNYIAADAGAVLTVVDQYDDRARPDGAVIDLAALLSDLPSNAPAPRLLEPDPTRLICLLYTSGTTGNPKGVRQTHAALIGRIIDPPFEPGPDEVSVFRTSPNFIDSICEVFGPLSRGRTVAVPTREERTNVRRFIDFLDTHRVTRVLLVPSVLRAILEATPDFGRRAPSARTWLSCAEPIEPALARAFADGAFGAILLNIYGATEVWDATCGVVDPQDSDVSVIGRPTKGSYVHILDPRQKLAPRGVVGELYVGGESVASGYHAAPTLTDARFLVDPFRAGRKLYKTGDLARLRSDGSIVLLGRRDRQVKVRGHRVELAEVEMGIMDHPAVASAVVVATSDGLNQTRLTGFCVLREGAEADRGQIRADLRQRLPDHLVPQVLRVVDLLPLMGNGKLDMQALQEMAEEPPPAPAEKLIAPRNGIEQAVARLVAAAVGVPVALPDADFFDLGLNSLQATGLLNWLERIFGVEIGLRRMMQASTAHEISELIRFEVRAQNRTTAILRLLEDVGHANIGIAFPRIGADPLFARDFVQICVERLGVHMDVEDVRICTRPEDLEELAASLSQPMSVDE
jgi:iturin family lipopeptide synthetase A